MINLHDAVMCACSKKEEDSVDFSKLSRSTMALIQSATDLAAFEECMRQGTQLRDAFEKELND